MKKISLYVIVVAGIFILFACSHGERDETAVKQADFPENTVEMIVSYSAGAATDAQARPLTKYFQDTFGQSLVIINISGAGGTTGWNQFVQQETDGYNLCAYNLPHIISKSMLEETIYHWDDFIPVAHWGYDPVAVGVLPDSMFDSLEDIVKYAVNNPGALTVGTAGLYVGQHLALLQFELAAGIETTMVPFPGAADAQAALLGGQIDVQFGNLSDMYRLADDINILAVASKERHEFLPDVPNFNEFGYQVVMSTDRGIAVQKGTPQETIDILEKGFLSILNDPDYQEDMKNLGAPLRIMGAVEAKDHIQNYAEIIEELLIEVGELED